MIFGAAIIAQAATGPLDAALVQYGVLGIFATMLALAVRVLFNRETKGHDRERERADKLADQLDKVNKESRDSLLVIGEALKTVGHAMEAMSEALAKSPSGSYPQRRRDD